MKFELDFNQTNFVIELLVEKNFIPDERFDKLSPQTMIALKKNQIRPYSLLITSKRNEDEMTFYISNVLLSSNPEEVLEELQDYLDHENIIEDICESWEKYYTDGPLWKI